MSLEEGDKEAAAVQKTPNRVTLESLYQKIDTVEAWSPNCCPHMTVVAVKLKNGFTIIGKSAPADPENYNFELGIKFAKEDALRQMWPLEGYLLCEQLSKGE